MKYSNLQYEMYLRRLNLEITQIDFINIIIKTHKNKELENEVSITLTKSLCLKRVFKFIP